MQGNTDAKPVALLSASNKDEHLRAFAEGLIGNGWRILASKGTKDFLDRHFIPSDEVGTMVGPPILGHRVVTLSREVYAALLSRLGNEEDIAELKRIGVEPISLVYVDLYPLAEELAKADCTFESVIEKTDIGGPTLLRAAAKGERLVVSSPHQFDDVLRLLREYTDSNPFRKAKFLRQLYSKLAAEAEETVVRYAALSAAFHRSVAEGDFPDRWKSHVRAPNADEEAQKALSYLCRTYPLPMPKE